MMHTINCAVCTICTTLLISYSFFSICAHKTQILGFITDLICQVCNAKSHSVATTMYYYYVLA